MHVNAGCDKLINNIGQTPSAVTKRPDRSEWQRSDGLRKSGESGRNRSCSRAGAVMILGWCCEYILELC